VEARARGVEVQWSVWLDLRRGPSAFRGEVHVEYVVGHDLSDFESRERIMEKRRQLAPPQTRECQAQAVFLTFLRG